MGEKREEEEKKGGEFFDGFYHRCVYERVCSVNLLIYLGGICLVILISQIFIIFFLYSIYSICLYVHVSNKQNKCFLFSLLDYFKI